MTKHAINKLESLFTDMINHIKKQEFEEKQQLFYNSFSKHFFEKKDDVSLSNKEKEVFGRMTNVLDSLLPMEHKHVYQLHVLDMFVKDTLKLHKLKEEKMKITQVQQSIIQILHKECELKTSELFSYYEGEKEYLKESLKGLKSKGIVKANKSQELTLTNYGELFVNEEKWSVFLRTDGKQKFLILSFPSNDGDTDYVLFEFSFKLNYVGVAYFNRGTSIHLNQDSIELKEQVKRFAYSIEDDLVGYFCQNELVVEQEINYNEEDVEYVDRKFKKEYEVHNILSKYMLKSFT